MDAGVHVHILDHRKGETADGLRMLVRQSSCWFQN